MDRHDVEELILMMADIVCENRYLRQENQELREIKKQYNELLYKSCQDSEETNRLLVQSILVGAIKTNNIINSLTEKEI